MLQLAFFKYNIKYSNQMPVFTYKNKKRYRAGGLDFAARIINSKSFFAEMSHVQKGSGHWDIVKAYVSGSKGIDSKRAN